MPVYDYRFLLNEATDMMAAASTYTAGEINFGVTNPNCARSIEFGAHLVVTEAYTDVNSGCDVTICHGAATTPTTKLSTRRITKTELQTAGKHYFIPMPPSNLQYVRVKFVPVSETSSNGTCTMWLGPREGGEE